MIGMGLRQKIVARKVEVAVNKDCYDYLEENCDGDPQSDSDSIEQKQAGNDMENAIR